MCPYVTDTGDWKDGVTPEVRAYNLAFVAWLRDPERPSLTALKDVMLSELLAKASLSIDGLARDNPKPRGIRQPRG